MRAGKPSRDFKKGIDGDEARRRRADVTVELRKKNREDQIQKRRMKPLEENQPSENSENNPNGNNVMVPALQGKSVEERTKSIPALVAGVTSSDAQHQLACCVELRKLLSIERSPPIQAVIDAGVVPTLIELFKATHNETLQFEAAWTLTNIASGTTQHTECVVKAGGIQGFISLLHSPNAEVREQAVWGIGNIAGDSPLFRDHVIAAGGVDAILSVFNDQAKLPMLRNATWTISNLCRGKPQPALEQIRRVLPTVAQLLNMEDVELMTDACWTLSYISDDICGNNKIQAVLDVGVAARLVHCLSHHQTNVQVPALRCIGNIVTGDDSQTQTILAHNPLPSILGLMSHRKRNIRKEACWTISNITAGNERQIQTVLNANLIPPLVCMVETAEFEIKKEAAWALSNATSGGNPEQIRFLVDRGVIPALCGLFTCTDPKMILVALEGIENILKVGKEDALKNRSDNIFCHHVEACRGLDFLEGLQDHENRQVWERSLKVLREYFESEEEEEDQMVPAVDANTNMFSFGLNQPNAVAPQNFAF